MMVDWQKTLDRYKSINSFYRCSEVELFNETEWSYIMRKYNLTTREIEVAKMTLKGLSYDKIAKHLNVESSTIKVHLRNIYKKIQVNSKMMLILTFMDYINKLNMNS